MRHGKYRIFVINPGSTSTKLAMFSNDEKVFETSVTHDASVLNSFENVNDQFEYRMGVIEDFVRDNDIELDNVDAFVGRGGGCWPVPSGTSGKRMISMPSRRVCTLLRKVSMTRLS